MQTESDIKEAAETTSIPDISYSRMEATHELYGASHQLKNINMELKTYALVFLDENSSCRIMQEYTGRITHSIIPAISKIMSIIDNSDKHIAPYNLFLEQRLHVTVKRGMQ